MPETIEFPRVARSWIPFAVFSPRRCSDGISLLRSAMRLCHPKASYRNGGLLAHGHGVICSLYYVLPTSSCASRPPLKCDAFEWQSLMVERDARIPSENPTWQLRGKESTIEQGREIPTITSTCDSGFYYFVPELRFSTLCGFSLKPACT